NLLRYLEWRWWEHCDEYVCTGKPLRVHQTMTEEEWAVYQRGMRSGIEMPAHWVAHHLPLPHTARQMLDIGGIDRCHERRLPNLLRPAPPKHLERKWTDAPSHGSPSRRTPSGEGAANGWQRCVRPVAIPRRPDRGRFGRPWVWCESARGSAGERS